MIPPPRLDNRTLAKAARTLAAGAPVGSLAHAAAVSVAATCAATRNLAHAKDALAGIDPPRVRLAALQLFDRLTAPQR